MEMIKVMLADVGQLLVWCLNLRMFVEMGVYEELLNVTSYEVWGNWCYSGVLFHHEQVTLSMYIEIHRKSVIDVNVLLLEDAIN